MLCSYTAGTPWFPARAGRVLLIHGCAPGLSSLSSKTNKGNNKTLHAARPSPPGTHNREHPATPPDPRARSRRRTTESPARLREPSRPEPFRAGAGHHAAPPSPTRSRSRSRRRPRASGPGPAPPSALTARGRKRGPARPARPGSGTGRGRAGPSGALTAPAEACRGHSYGSVNTAGSNDPHPHTCSAQYPTRLGMQKTS